MKRPLAFLTLVCYLLFPASTIFAQGAVTFTQTYHNATDTHPDVDPCSGITGHTTIVYNGVLHTTTTPNGAFHLTGTLTGDFVFVPDDPANLTVSGSFAVHFGDTFNNKTESHTSTLTAHATRSDGSAVDFHITAHIAINANGEALVDFSRLRCSE